MVGNCSLQTAAQAFQPFPSLGKGPLVLLPIQVGSKRARAAHPSLCDAPKGRSAIGPRIGPQC